MYSNAAGGYVLFCRTLYQQHYAIPKNIIITWYRTGRAVDCLIPGRVVQPILP